MKGLYKHLKSKLKLLLVVGVLLSLSIGQVLAQEKTITGKVTEQGTDVGLPGVAIVVKGTATGTITDIDGNYQIAVSEGETLIFTFVGMLTKEQTVGGESVINITLEADRMGVEEVVVVGYGTKKKGNITGSIQTVDAEKIEQMPVASFDQALQGQASGVQVISSSGRPGAGASIRIRGSNSINSSNQPLYIVDGVEMSAGDFSTFNTSDFASINVLKDASLTSIYGAKAANGVIVATTKRGNDSQKTKITYRTQFGKNTIARNNFTMMNSAEKIQYELDLGAKEETMYNGELWILEDGEPTYRKDSLLAINTNWQDHLFRNGNMMSHELSALGGNERTQFYTSAAYYYQEGILPRSDFKRYTFRLNLDHNAKKWLRIGNTLSLGYEKNNFSVADGGYGNNIYNPVFAAYLLNPYTKPYDDEGNFTDKGLPYANPLEQLYMNDDYSTYLKIQGLVYAEFKLARDLKYRIEFGGDASDFYSTNYISPYAAWGLENGGTVSHSFARLYTVDFKNIITYNKSWMNIHNLSVIGGHQRQQFRSESFGATGKGLPNDKVRVMSATAEPQSASGGIFEDATLSNFIQASYNFDHKYFIDASARVDGSARFGENNKWADFYSLGLMWNLLKENFMGGTSGLSQLKLSATTGTLGNSNLPAYGWRAFYAYGTDYNGNNGSYPETPGNPDLSWESLWKNNVGIEVGYNNRLNLRFDYYYNITTDMFFPVPYSWTTGFNTVYDNLGKMRNSGFDFSLNWTAMSTTNFFWELGGNISHNNNVIEELYNGLEEIPSGSGADQIAKVGYPIGQFYMVRYAGVNPANGEPLWYTKDGELTNVYSESNRVIIEGKQSIGPISGGFSSNMNYRGIGLNILFSFVKDKYMVNNTRYFTESNGQFNQYNQTTNMLDHWKNPGDITEVPHPSYAQSYFDTRLLEDASFLRLKNVSLSYNLPKNILQKSKVVQDFKIYIQAQNLWTLSEYEGYDPENDGAYELNAYPHAKTFTLGIDISF
jgi:TonB-linked SusC/RagA family outer membrane protein